ncbi:hypothetical protein [Kineococcus sp. SYSU DK002]|uniref:hypothetical protein n=1 Tax=Kineococcus sp. SYSU DK002 TaxID=3383123 RepID=UPI003D7EFDA0
MDDPGAARPLSADEADVLAAPGCPCGCGTTALLVTDAHAPRASVLDAHPAAADFTAPGQGGVVTLTTADGLLQELRLSWWGEEPTPMPRAADLTHPWCAPGR